jgi:hypothetical protein
MPPVGFGIQDAAIVALDGGPAAAWTSAGEEDTAEHDLLFQRSTTPLVCLRMKAKLSTMLKEHQKPWEMLRRWSHICMLI